jgi:pimeloyl-ACP methyl ester carboxylesterase
VRADWWERTGPVPLAGFGYRVRLIAGLDLRSRLGEVTAPAQVIVAPDDRLVPPACGRELARRLPRARLIRARVGHAGLVHPRFDLTRVLDDPRFAPPA